MDYNTREKHLVLPEYGRNIQNMVDHCVAIEDAEERKRCAQTIIHIMGSMFPHLRDVNDFKHILWDHLAIMSDFKLDIEYPYEIVQQEQLYARPPRIPYTDGWFRYRHYGKSVQRMVERAVEMEPSEMRDRLIYLIAVQMKKSYLQWNKDTVSNEKIFDDLAELSEGRILLYSDICKLPDSRDLLNIRGNGNNNSQNNRRNNNRKGR